MRGMVNTRTTRQAAKKYRIGPQQDQRMDSGGFVADRRACQNQLAQQVV
jgi:hypothetical protein